VKVLVRPEKISVLESEESVATGAGGMNECTGVVSQISFVGGMTRFELTTPTGPTLLVKTISARAAERSPMGRPLTVRWSARDSTVLKK
jgi:putative spermidine/putrescine transport system ATP-binding protein